MNFEVTSTVFVIHLRVDLACVFVWKWKCVCWSLRVFVWEYKRIKACSQPRVQTGPFLTIPSGYPIGWWGINLPLCCYMCTPSLLDCVITCLQKVKFSSVFNNAKNPLPLQLWPEKPPLLSPAVASVAVLLIAFSTLYLVLTCTFFWSLATGVDPEHSSSPSGCTDSTPVTQWLPRLSYTRADIWRQLSRSRTFYFSVW